MSNATGDLEVWVQPLSGSRSPVRVSARGGVEPLWARNSQELDYLEGTKTIEVAIDARHRFNFSPPALLFEYRYPRSSQPPSYDVAGDGRFLLLKPTTTTPPPINRHHQLDSERRKAK